jgi:hypothetical protein
MLSIQNDTAVPLIVTQKWSSACKKGEPDAKRFADLPLRSLAVTVGAGKFWLNEIILLIF